jgi:4-hydroxybenzoate polyprenyltransferase
MSAPLSRPADSARPLCVDLDGTLIASDALWESMLLLVKDRPWSTPLVPLWLLGGRARLKRELSDRVLPDPATLPYRPEVLGQIDAARRAGRQVLLVTASDQRIADRVGAHLGLFDEVIGSDGARNLKGREKARYLVERFGERGFDYLGDSSADLPVWQRSHTALAVTADPAVGALARGASTHAEVVELKRKSRARALAKALRPHQWMKNVLLFVAPVLAHIREPERLFLVLAAFAAFSLTASSVYVLNDLLDLEQDRQHRTKKNRPFAAGTLSIPLGLALFPAVMLGGVGISVLFLPPRFTLALLGYLVLTTLYSVYLKRKLIVDVLTLGGLFTYRVLAGGLALGVVVSFWLLAFSMFFFTGLAFVKRFSELIATQARDLEKVPGRNYWISDLQVVAAVGPSSGLMAVLVFCLYINSPEVQQLYAHPKVLWLICPVLLYWITRIWFLAGRNQLHDDPVLFAIRDRISYLAGAVTMACLMAATWTW